jgi:hypothetical protein
LAASINRYKTLFTNTTDQNPSLMEMANESAEDSDKNIRQELEYLKKTENRHYQR